MNIVISKRPIMAAIIVLATSTPPALAGGNIETLDLTGDRPINGLPLAILAEVVDVKWDARCIPVSYSINDTLDPIPNPLGADFLPLAEARAALADAFDIWNEVPTSFIEMQITSGTANAGAAAFDMVNELTFRPETLLPFNVIASSFTRALVRDTRFVPGDDIDGDGDSDVASGIGRCQDADGDGDIEFPPGFYPAGTILENDVAFNTSDTRLTVDVTETDDEADSVDLIAVAVHEFGHSHGLAHTRINQLSATDGTAASMFPTLHTNDAANELAVRTLSPEDIAFSSFYYPEGSADSGPAALQADDVAFDEVFGLISGEVWHGELDQPVAGASIFAIEARTGEITGSAFSGTIQCAFHPLRAGCIGLRILDGRYVLPVPRGIYRAGVEATDESPAGDAAFNVTVAAGQARAAELQRGIPQRCQRGCS